MSQFKGGFPGIFIKISRVYMTNANDNIFLI